MSDIPEIQKYKAILKEIVTYTKAQDYRNIKDAGAEMVGAAKESTPPPIGAKRGVNTWSGNLKSKWECSVEKRRDGFKAILMNDTTYASYVNDGHVMRKHFVPWLYIDKSGILSRHLPSPGEPLFGLVVGTKTAYVPPYNMVKHGTDRFISAYEHMTGNLVKDIQSRLNR